MIYSECITFWQLIFKLFSNACELIPRGRQSVWIHEGVRFSLEVTRVRVQTYRLETKIYKIQLHIIIKKVNNRVNILKI